MHKAQSSLNLEFLGNLSSELKQRRTTVELLSFEAETKGQEFLKLNSQIWKFWDDLERCLPRALVGPLYSPPILDQKATLLQWSSGITSLLSKSPEQSWLNLNLSSDLQALEIWCDTDNVYWPELCSLLISWLGLTRTKLNITGWTTEQETVEVTLEVVGALKSIEILSFKGTEHKFWTVSLSNTEQPFCLAEASNISLLGIQLFLQWGGNLLIPVELQEGELAMRLKIPRADTLVPQIPVSFVSDTVFDQVLSFILSQGLTRYVEASQQLESALSREIDRLQSYVTKGIIKVTLVDSLQHVLGDLALMKEAVISLS